jgi:release factor glutamine methyltransferase
VPRPDTEILVETVLSLNLPFQTSMVDLGTGTGAIAFIGQ